MKIVHKIEHCLGTTYHLFGLLGLAILHENVITWKAKNIFVIGFWLGDVGFWFGTPKTQIHIFYL